MKALTFFDVSEIINNTFIFCDCRWFQTAALSHLYLEFYFCILLIRCEFILRFYHSRCLLKTLIPLINFVILYLENRSRMKSFYCCCFSLMNGICIVKTVTLHLFKLIYSGLDIIQIIKPVIKKKRRKKKDFVAKQKIFSSDN